MDKHRALPPEYMTVGAIAKKMGVTVRTLQYYDKEGLLSPSYQSEGGRRLYTDKDMVKLHQILSFKYLGFSLEEIKSNLISLDTPEDVANALSNHAVAIREKMEALSESLTAIEALKAEVLQMQTVDFTKYADIVVNLQMKNEFYWMIKLFDDDMLAHVRSRFDKESGLHYMEAMKRLQHEAIQLQKDGISPDCESAQALAKEFWDLVMEFTDGDMSLLPKLIEFSEKENVTDSDWVERQAAANVLIEPALGIYFTQQGYNPFEEMNHDSNA